MPLAAELQAAMAVVVDTKDEAAAALYLHFGFMPLSTRVTRLFLPMSTIAKLFAQSVPVMLAHSNRSLSSSMASDFPPASSRQQSLNSY